LMACSHRSISSHSRLLVIALNKMTQLDDLYEH
jgi:hypothetical protein